MARPKSSMMDFANFGANVYHARQTSKIAQAQQDQNEILQAELGMMRQQQEMAAMQKDRLVAARNLLLMMDDELERIKLVFPYYPGHTSLMYDMLSQSFDDSGLNNDIFEEIVDIERFNQLKKEMKGTQKKVLNLTEKDLQIKSTLLHYTANEPELIEDIDTAKVIENFEVELETLKIKWDQGKNEWSALERANEIRRMKYKKMSSITLVVSLIGICLCYFLTSQVFKMTTDETGGYLILTFGGIWLIPFLVFAYTYWNPVISPNHPLNIVRERIPEVESQLSQSHVTFANLSAKYNNLYRSPDLEALRSEWNEYVDIHSPGEDEDFEDRETEHFQHAAPIPRSPPVLQPRLDATGVLGDDGYEWIQYPAQSGTWYWRDQQTGQWVRH
jgi:hypothetical protein